MRLITILPALTIFLLTACKNETAKEQPFVTVPDVTKNNQENVVRLMFERFNRHDWEGMAALYTDTAEFKDPSFGKGIVKQTRAETVKKYKELNALFTNFRDSVIGVYPSGDKYVTVEFISKGTAPDGTLFELPICSILTVENGFISKDFTYYDNER